MSDQFICRLLAHEYCSDHVHYQYNLVNAANHYIGLAQTETVSIAVILQARCADSYLHRLTSNRVLPLRLRLQLILHTEIPLLPEAWAGR